MCSATLGYGYTISWSNATNLLTIEDADDYKICLEGESIVKLVEFLLNNKIISWELKEKPDIKFNRV